MSRARQEGSHQIELMQGGTQAFMELARQSPQLIGGLPEPMVQAINRNDTEELQRIFRCITSAGASDTEQQGFRALSAVPQMASTYSADFLCWDKVNSAWQRRGGPKIPNQQRAIWQCTSSPPMLWALSVSCVSLQADTGAQTGRSQGAPG